MRGWVAAMHTDVVGERMGDAKHRQRPPIGPLAVAIAKRAPREHRNDRPVQLSRATVARAFLSWDAVSVAKTASQENK